MALESANVMTITGRELADEPHDDGAIVEPIPIVAWARASSEVIRALSPQMGKR